MTQRFKIILSVCFFLLVSNILFAQEITDIISLKDGSILKGKIIEYKTDDYIKIEISGGNIVTIKMSEVKLISKTGNLKAPKLYTPRSKGYYNLTQLGLLFGNSDYYYSVTNPSFQMINGFQFNNRFHLGFGFGFEGVGIANIPLFADFKYDLLKSSITPFAFAQAGFVAPLGNANSWWYDGLKYKGGYIGDIGFGIRNYLNDKTAFTVCVGYRHQNMKSTYNHYYYGKTTRIEYFNRVGIQIGLLFR